MEYKIQKFQQGGGWASFTPVIYQQPATESSKTESKDDKKSKNTISSLLSDDMFEKLVGDGLINDVNLFINNIVKLESSSINPLLQSNNRHTALKLIGKINELKQNKKYWDESVQTAKSNGSYGEIAVGSYNELYVKDGDGNVKQIDLNTYKQTKDKENFKVLTVAELMNERQYNPKLVGQNSLFDVANNSIGLDKITDQIGKIVKSIGMISKEETNSYSGEMLKQQLSSLKINKKPTQSEIESINELSKILSVESDYYKITDKNSSNSQYVTKALNYIWTTLGQSAQNKMTAVAITNGMNNPQELIFNLLTSQDVTSNRSIVPEKNPGSSSSNDSDGGFKNKPITPFELSHNGKTGKQIFNWNDPSTGKTFDLIATSVFRVSSVEGKPLGMTTLKSVLNTEVGTLVDTNKAFFGDQLITTNDLQNIVYDGNASARVYIPVTSSGAPDYNKLKEIQELEKQVFSNKSLSPQQINEIFHKHGLTFIQVDENKQYKMNDRFKPFLVMYGYTGEDANSVKNNGKIKALSSSEEDGVIQSLKDTWKNDKVAKPPIGWDWTTTYYSGMIAIPYKDDSSMYAASIAKNFLAPQVTLDYAKTSQNKEKATKLNASSSLIF